MGTLRQDMLEKLRQRPRDVRQLARELGLREREAAEHLEHAVRSLAAHERLREQPAACLACGFAFRNRVRLRPPSRCPRCRSERVEPAVYWIEGCGG